MKKILTTLLITVSAFAGVQSKRSVVLAWDTAHVETIDSRYIGRIITGYGIIHGPNEIKNNTNVVYVGMTNKTTIENIQGYHGSYYFTLFKVYNGNVTNVSELDTVNILIP